MTNNAIKELRTVILEKRGMIGILTMNRPEKLNALNADLLTDLCEGIRQFNEDEEVRVIVLKGAGRAFCAGFDISPREKPLTTVQEWRAHTQLCNSIYFAIWNSKQPVIASVQGYSMGGGCDLAMVCDFTVASEEAIFGEPEIQFGSGSAFLIMPWAVGMKKAKYMLMTGDRVSAAEAERIGMVTRVVPADKLDEEVIALARKLAKIPVPAMQLNKEVLNRNYEIEGFMNSVLCSRDVFIMTILSETPESVHFHEIVKRDGLAAAFKWRDAFFAEQGAE